MKPFNFGFYLFSGYLLLVYHLSLYFLRVVYNIVISIYFLCLDTKKVTKKNQGQHDASGRLSIPRSVLRVLGRR